MNEGEGIRKKTFLKPVRVPGTKYSIHNAQLLTSTGLDSLDPILGGGVIIGSVVLIEEDPLSTCCEAVLQHYFAEGIAVGHKLFLGSKKPDSMQLLKKLPQPVDSADSPLVRRPIPEEPMKIAFQYQRLPSFPSAGSAIASTARVFDCGKSMAWEVVEKNNPVVYNSKEHNGISFYDQLLNEIITTIDKENPSSRVVRIGLQSLHSPRWYLDDNPDENCKKFCRFLYKLRAVLRSSIAVCFITVPTHLETRASTIKRIERMCDTVLRIESFEGNEHGRNPAFRNYQGVLQIRKLPTFNSQTCFHPSSKEFGIKIGKRRLTFETLHLPPLFDSTKGDDAVSGCGSSRGSKLDF